MPDPSDDEIDLGISLETVATIVDHARAVQGTETPDADAEPDSDDTPSDIEDDLDEDSLRAAILALNDDEQASLIALAWVGRGDYTPEEWEEARSQAAERDAAEDAAETLLAMDNFGDLLAEGAGALGLAIEEVER